MIATLVFALALRWNGGLTETFHSGMLWEETPEMEKEPGVHLMVRFNTPSTMIRFSPSRNYMVVTPDMIQQGQFQYQDGHFNFRAVSAFELENADIAKITADMEPHAGHSLAEAYARSMSNFEGDYNESSQTLSVSYPVKGYLQGFNLHATNEGDDQLPLDGVAANSGLIGLWQGVEPYPGKLDARTRAKIELDGLQHFAKEAMASNSAQFSLLDLRRDGRFRIHSTVGTWRRNGSILVLLAENKETDLAISSDGSKLLTGGKPIYVRN